MWFEFLHGFHEPVVFLTPPGKMKATSKTQEMGTKKYTDDSCGTVLIHTDGG